MNQRVSRFTLLFLALYAAVAIVFIFRLGLTEQEAYYWLWSKNLDWGYFDHPPLQAWVTAFLTSLFGDEKWVVRLPAFLGDFATLFLFYRWTQDKWGNSVAQLASLLLISSSVFLLGSVIALPDSFAVPLGLATIISAEKGQTRRTALLLGLALLAKWTVLFIVPGVFYQFYRQKKLTGENFLILALVPLLFQSPVIWWNIQHGAASLKFHLYDRHSHELLPFLTYLKNFMSFVFAQIFELGIVCFTLLLLLLIRLNKTKPLQVGAMDWPSLIAWSAPGMAVVIISSVQGELRFYWTFLSLLPLIAAIGYLIHLNRPANAKLITISVVAIISFNWTIAAIAGFYPTGDAVEAAFSLRPDLRHSPVGEIFGWKHWADEELLSSHALDTSTAVIGTDLHVTSRLAWAMRKSISTKAFGVGGDNKNQFQFWPQPAPPEFKKAIFFGDNRYDKFKNFAGLCEHPVKWQDSPVQVMGKTIKVIHWSVCQSLRPLAQPQAPRLGSLPELE